jgi:hypothetical protein
MRVPARFARRLGGGILSRNKIDGLGINEYGQIGGLTTSDPSDWTTYHALLRKNGVMTNLKTKIPADSGWQLCWALGNNEQGQIVDVLFHQITGKLRACLLTPN